MKILKALGALSGLPIVNAGSSVAVKIAEVSGKMHGFKNGFAAGAVVTLLAVGGTYVAIRYVRGNCLSENAETCVKEGR